jgi:hypothetical protein
MTTLADQLSAILNSRIPDALAKGEVAMAEMLSEQMKDNSARGYGFGNDPYDNTYSRRSKSERSKMGLQIGTVELRRGNNRIETTKVEPSRGRGATIRFGEGGNIFKEHHLGQTISTKPSGRLPIRSIWPKSYESVPRDIIEDTMIVVKEVLCGNK